MHAVRMVIAIILLQTNRYLVVNIVSITSTAFIFSQHFPGTYFRVGRTKSPGQLYFIFQFRSDAVPNP